VNCINRDHDKQCIKFLAINVDFNGISRNLLGSRKPLQEGIKKRYPLKVVILLPLASTAWKRLQIGMDMLPITTSPSNELFSCINIDDFKRPWTPKISGFIVFTRKSRMLCASLPSSGRLSVCLSHLWAVSKRCKLGSQNLHCGLLQGL